MEYMRSIVHWIDKRINWLAAAVLVISLLPILYCGLWIYPTADEMSKSYMVRAVVQDGGNLFDVLRSCWNSMFFQWATVEGNFASNFVMAFQPGIWGDHGLAVTVPLCVLYVTLGSAYLCHELFVESYGMSRKACAFLVIAQVFLILQYMPYIRGGMFMYVGMVHYFMPMCFVLLMTAWMMKWLRTGKKRYVVYMLLCAVYIGGSHYQHGLVMLLILLTTWVVVVVRERVTRKAGIDPVPAAGQSAAQPEAPVIGVRIHLVWILIAIIAIGIVISALSPGNVSRGEGTYGLHITSILLMPASCAVAGARHAVEYIMNAPLLIVYAIVLWYVGQHGLSKEPAPCLRRVPAVIIALYLFLLYAATEAPAIYAADNPEGISGAYYDTVYQSLVLVMSVGIPLLASRAPRLRARKAAVGIVCLLLCVLCVKPSVKHSSLWTCVDFLRSSHFADYRIQMDEQLSLLEDPDLTDVVVPEMNNEQGPYLILQLSQDSGNYTNWANALYYGKNTVTAVPRDVYYAEYAAAQGHEIPAAYRDLYGN